MLTLQQAYEVKASIIEYLKATFTFKDKELNGAFSEFMEGMFKGPYISLKLPFVKADPKEDIPLEIKPAFTPFYHQFQAFKKLSTANGSEPKPTLLTTGTGSGKTEAFLFPVLDYCYKNISNSGIKVIILYPMNALATDQAKRLADTIHNDDRLKGKIRAGLFIGESLDRKKQYPKVMGKDNIIENRDEIIQAPPDILLTNFKMLDFALMQSKYHNLWKHNFAKPELLKFIILDELHTYEGAQGSDVANLIRRLKLKLDIPNDYLCPIGTSATIGKGDESKSLLADFATKVFGEDFTEDSIIEEHRISLEDFFKDYEQRNFVPTVHMLKGSRLKTGDNFSIYIQNQLNVWGLDPNISQLTLTEELKNYQIIKDLIQICNEGILTIDELIVKLGMLNKEFSAVPKWDDAEGFSPKEAVIRSILSLISYSKVGIEEKQFPFLYLQVQLWIRELSGFVRKVDDKPTFLWREDIDASNSEKALPSFFCRECGASGWFAVKQESKDRFEIDINDVYKKFFSHHKNLYLVIPFSNDNLCIDEYEPTDVLEYYLNKHTLTLSSKPNENSFKIIAYRKLSKNYNKHICPMCNSENTINIIGQRVATLASITTSQLLSTDLDSNIEKDRKVLAFTNGVQDAAHQAGYIEARNYRFTFRTALQKVINILNKPVSVAELQDEFINYWSANADESGKKNIFAYFYKLFPTDHSADVSIENRYKKNQKEFLDEFNNRVNWEIASEFGYNSIIGRTLEKTGSCATFFDKEKLKETLNKIKPWLDSNALENISENEFLNFLIIFLQRLRTRGGVDQIYLNRFRTGRSSYYQITQSVNPQHFLIRNFGKNTRLPKLITDQTNTYGVFDLTTRSAATNWFHTYFTKAFPLMPNNTDLVNEFYTHLLETLSSDPVKIISSKDAQGIRNYAILPQELFVGKDVRIFECSSCGNRISTTVQNADLIPQSKCMVYRCNGSYIESKLSVADNYYQQVYNRGRAPRIYAADHTGLLDRKVREEIENDFKLRPKFDSKNTLVATSTLEMGIDIGSLNSAINTSIPPLPSNYMQRIGRAGRGSGSAIIINFVPNEAHDLYYFESPLEMMDGEINTPGCYLEAKEIIRRHFLAYCIDQWTKDDPGKNTMPAILRFLHLETLDTNNPDFFINGIIAFIKKNEEEIFNRFKLAFREKVSDKIFDVLREQIKTNDFFTTIKKAFSALKDEILNLRAKLQGINEYVKERNLDKTDPEFIELKTDYRNILASIALIKKRQIIEHMINEGLLPNYAFPETGVTLKAQISRRRDDDPKTYDIKSLEVVRPARSALRELVPDNLFYTQGYKLHVSGVNVVNWRDEVIDYRFCSNCDHIAPDIPPVSDRCPKCGSETWKTPRNTHKVIRLKTVISFNDEKHAKLDDSAEEREKKISIITQHFEFNPSSMQGSYVMQKIPFGIEYVKDVSVIEMNTGLHDSKLPQNNNITLNTIEIPKPGFIICRNCGKVTTSVYNDRHEPIKPESYHFGFCKNKSKAYQNIPDEFFEEVFFFRSMSTEAIKILLPVQEFNTESSVKLFKAGINFGLKKYYRGKPDHLTISEYTEFNQQTQKNDRFLVLYDIIPGGTGYLSKLFDVDQFNIILKEAHVNIRDCKCKLEGKDGCYNCIYTYGNQFEREELSRAKAEELFERIIRASGEWDYFPGGLGKITNSGKIEESELEEKFIKALSDYFNDPEKPESKFSPKTVDGITRYILEINQNSTRLVYEVKPQVELGPADGIKYTTIADFIVTLLSIKKDGIEEKEVLSKYKPLVIYLDGYQYHASAENNRFITDLEKRKSILDSNKYWLWILTWKDVELFQNSNSNGSKKFNDFLKERLDSEVPNNVKTEICKHPLLSSADESISKSKNNFDRFIWLIENYYLPYFQDELKKFTFKFQSIYPKNCITLESAKDFINSPSKSFPDYQTGNFPDGYLYIDLLSKDDFYEYRILQYIRSLNYKGNLFIRSQLPEYNKNSWETFWLIFNIIQFGYDNINFIYYEKPDKVEAEEYTGIEYILENFDDKYHPLVKILLDKNIEFSKDDYFHLKDNDNQIIAEAFLGLPVYKIVIDPLSDEFIEIFKQNGYKTFSLENFDITTII